MPPSTLTGLLERQRLERSSELAFVEGARTYTYAELHSLAGRARTWLAAQGVGRGDRVAVWLVNRSEWLALLFALASLGATLVAANTRYRAAELEYLLSRSKARLLVMQRDFRHLDFNAVLKGVAPQHLPPVADIGAGFGSLESAAPLAAGDPEALAALFATSGTTKGPKLVMHPQRTLALHADRVASAWGLDKPGARLLGAMPYCGVYGLCAALAALAGGAPIINMETPQAQAAAELVRKHAITHIFSSDELYRRMGEAVPGEDPFPSARLFGYAAFQPGAPELARDAWRWRMPLFGLYGSSEVQALFSVQRPELPLEQRIEPGGLPSSQDAEVRVRELDSGQIAAPGVSGELEIRAPTNFIGYLDDAHATAQALTEDGFFRTGDIGRMREDGSFVYETRKGDAIRLGGFLVNPAEIEDLLKRIGAVADVQVTALEIAGQLRCVAFVVPAAGASPTEAALIEAARAIMAGFKVPARVWFVEDFPITQSANGTKVQRARLREMARERLGFAG
jgi:fatty-acyl-CoA synthase